MEKTGRVALGILVATTAIVITYLSYQYHFKKRSNQKKLRSKKKVSTTSNIPSDNKSEASANDIDSLRAKGNAKFGEKKYQEAIDLYSLAIAKSDSADHLGLAKCLGNKAYCHIKLEDYKTAINDCTEALSHDPNYVRALQRRATAYESVDDLKSALNDLISITKIILPSNKSDLKPSQQQQEVMENIDRLLKAISTEKAKEALKNKIGSFPTSSVVKSYYESFKRDLITESFDELKSKMSEGDESANLHFGLKLIEAEKYDEALIHFNQFLKKFPNNFTALVEKATLLHLCGKVEEALELYEQANRISPDDPHVLVKWANAFLFADKLDEANALLDKAVAIAPEDSAVLFHYGESCNAQRRHEDAISFYNKVIAVDPAHYEAYNHKGLACLAFLESKAPYMTNETQKIQEAKEAFERAIEIAPSRAEAYNNYGLLYSLLQEPTKAHDLFDNALKVDPGNSTAFTRKAVFFLVF
ncbi:mitochondrial import receptor subunit TOM70-like [Zophobas morio]|uniref:mitochondrial import receptor subunit TOM70-like n=1 Tax=Zophobas morio TaxID=2755281 RepID=UPI003082FB56